MNISEFEILEGEVWKTTPLLPPHIEVSSEGRVRKYITPTKVEEIIPKVAKEYYQINCNGMTYKVHGLVAEAFIPKPDMPGRLVVRHKNGNKHDNRVSNLEWVSNTDNLTKSYSEGSRKRIYCKELDKVFGTLRSAAYVTGLPQDVISDSIKNGYSVAGHTFEFVERDDPILSTHSTLYIDFEKMVKLSKTASDKEELRMMIEQEVTK